jgi:hypothetical protein
MNEQKQNEALARLDGWSDDENNPSNGYMWCKSGETPRIPSCLPDYLNRTTKE